MRRLLRAGARRAPPRDSDACAGVRGGGKSSSDGGGGSFLALFPSGVGREHICHLLEELRLTRRAGEVARQLCHAPIVREDPGAYLTSAGAPFGIARH